MIIPSSICLLGLMLYVPVNNFSDFETFFALLALTNTKKWIKCSAQGYNRVTPLAVSLELDLYIDERVGA